MFKARDLLQFIRLVRRHKEERANKSSMSNENFPSDKSVSTPSPRDEIKTMQSERAEAIADHLKKYKPELIAGLCLKLLLPLEDDEIVSLFKQLTRFDLSEATRLDSIDPRRRREKIEREDASQGT